jgi:hypothetical protein
MSFLNPILLFGLAAVSAPIIIHLFNRRKFEKVVWGAMRFLRISVEQTQRRLKLEELFLLLLRCLLVAMLALALARPAFRGTQSAGFLGQAPVTSVIILDNSYSMCLSDGISTRFDLARQAALDALSGMPAGSSAALILASDIAQAVIPKPTLDLNFVRKCIQTARLCDRGTELMPAFQRAVSILKPLSGRREIYTATDGQLGGFRQMDSVCKLLDGVKPDIAAHVLLVGIPQRQNLGISDMRTLTEIPVADQPLKFAVQITNFGQVEAAGVHVTLRVDSDPPCDEATIDSLPCAATKIVTLFARLKSDQYHTVTASIPADRLPADDARVLAVHAVKNVNVLLVDPKPAATPRDAETFFIRHALVPVSRESTDRYFIKTRVISSEDLAAQSLDDFDAVILCDVPGLPANTLESLAGYLRRGNTLMVFPGPDIDTSFYNKILAQQWGFLPAKFGDPVGDPAQTDKFSTLQHTHFIHPIVDLWNDSASGNPAAAHFFRILPLQPQPAPSDQPDAGEAHVVMTYENEAGTPAVMERRWGTGRVIQFSSTASTSWNDLPAHAGLFVPLIRRTLGWAMQQQDRALNVTVGDTLFLHPPASTLDEQAVITPIGATENQRFTRPIEFIDRLPTLSFPDTEIAGAYNVDLAGKTLKFAVQQRASTSMIDSESSLNVLAPKDTQKLSQSADVVLPGQPILEKVANERAGGEFWLPLIVIAIALATLETLVAHWFGLPK